MSISMAPKIHSFLDPLPPKLYWDASFIVNFSYEAAKYFQQCADFLVRLDERSTISYVSTLAMDEACFVLLQLKIEEDYHPARFWDVYNDDPSVIEQYVDDLKRLTEEIGTHPQIQLIGTEPFFAFESLTHMRAFHFLPRDAYHLTAMNFHNVGGIVTTDSDFFAAPGIGIFTCNPALLQYRA